jgi:multisubunit Na+/H+ antiporter MnhF subunit
MKLVSCEIIRWLVIISTVFLGLGILLFALLFAFSGGAPDNVFGLSFLYIALTLILTSPLVLAVNLLLSILPGSRKVLEHCNH